MKCSNIRKMLTDYLDGALNQHDKALVEEHLASCKNCAEELAFLKAYVKEAGSMEKMKAPEDFLEKVHQRLERRFSFEKLIRTLFVPPRIKIPLELAGVAATILVAFFIARFVMFGPAQGPTVMMAKRMPVIAPETAHKAREMAEQAYKYEVASVEPSEELEVASMPSAYEPSVFEGYADYDVGTSGGISGMSAAYYVPGEREYETPAAVVPEGTGIEGIKWELVEVYGREVPLLGEGCQPFLKLNAGTKSVGGYTGCNNFFGEYELEGESIKFGPLGMTYRYCEGPEGEAEKSFVKALEDTSTWQMEQNQLLLLSDDEIVARLK